MANGNLIQGARRLGQSKRFIDYGKILTRSIDTSKLDKALEEGRERYYRQQKEYEAKLGNYLSQKGTLDLTKVPDHAMSAVKDQLTAQKNAYAAAATASAQAKVASEEYNTAIDQMNSANNIIRNLDANLSGAATTIAEMQEAFDSQQFSKGNPDYNKYIQAIGDPNAENGPKYIFDDSGNLSIQLFDDNGNATETVAAKDLNKFFKKANDQINSVFEIAGKAEARGLSGLKYDEEGSKRQIAMALTDNRENLLSLARDAFVLDKPIISDANMETELYEGLTGRELLLRENQTQLKNFLTDKYIDAVKTGYDNGRSVYDEKKNENNDDDETPSQVKTLTSSMGESSKTIKGPLPINPATKKEYTIAEYNAFIQTPEGQKFDKETGGMFGVDEVKTNQNYANKLSVLLNGPRYGSKDIKYFTKEQLIAMVLQNEDKYEERGITKYATRPDIRGAEDFVNRTYGDSYLYSRDVSFGEANVQGIPVNAFEDDPFIEALLTGSGAVDDGL